MSGPPPKDPKLRQRRNRVSTAAKLTIASTDAAEAREAVAPPAVACALPPKQQSEIPWHPDTLAFWKEVWASPMAAEYIAADVPGLILLARLIDKFNHGDTSLAAEIRLQRQCFGLTPLDRRRLQWEIERATAAERKRPTLPSTMSTSGVRDPRRTLRAVK